MIMRCNHIRSGSLDGLVIIYRAFYLKVIVPNPDLFSLLLLGSALRQVLG